MSEQFVIVNVSNQRQLVRVTQIREVVAMVELSGTDSVAGRCRGLLNLRGEVVPVFEFGAVRGALSPSRFILITQIEDGPMGVIVDDVLGVVTVPSERVASRIVDHGRTLDCAEIEGQLLTIVQPREAARS